MQTRVPGALQVSALNSDDVQRVREKIFALLKERLEVIEVVIPYTESRLEASVRRFGRVEKFKYLDEGTFLRVCISEEWLKKLNLESFKI